MSYYLFTLLPFNNNVLAAYCRDEWHGEAPKLAERRRVSFGEFRFVPRGLLRKASLKTERTTKEPPL
jgi:hypothetical protein